jgi:hypothetical protein
MRISRKLKQFFSRKKRQYPPPIIIEWAIAGDGVRGKNYSPPAHDVLLAAIFHIVVFDDIDKDEHDRREFLLNPYWRHKNTIMRARACQRGKKCQIHPQKAHQGIGVWASPPKSTLSLNI